MIVLILVSVIVVLYVFLIRPKGEALNTTILSTSTALPLFTFIAVAFLELCEAIWEGIMLVKRVIENFRENRRDKTSQELKQTREQLKQTREQLKQTEQELKQTREKIT